MKQIQLPGGVLMVEIDKGWFEFEFNEANSRVLMFLTSEDIQHITVPPGKWEIIGLGKDLNNGDPDNDEILEYIRDYFNYSSENIAEQKSAYYEQINWWNQDN